MSHGKYVHNHIKPHETYMLLSDHDTPRNVSDPPSDLLDAIGGGEHDAVADQGAPAVQPPDAEQPVVDVGEERVLLDRGVLTAGDALRLRRRCRENKVGDNKWRKKTRTKLDVYSRCINLKFSYQKRLLKAPPKLIHAF